MIKYLKLKKGMKIKLIKLKFMMKKLMYRKVLILIIHTISQYSI
jgi:hypothetical protein